MRRGNLNAELEHLRTALGAPWTEAEAKTMEAQSVVSPTEVPVHAQVPSAVDPAPLASAGTARL